jgi:cysteine desulfurase
MGLLIFAWKLRKMKRVYLDNAATTPLDPAVLEAMLPYMKEDFGNPSSTHFYGRKTKAAIEAARKNVASLINAQPGEIVFTSGGTEADNMAIMCSVLDLGVTHIITSPVEHHAVIHTVEEMEKKFKVRVSWVKVQDNGHIDYNDLEKLLQTNDKTLVTLMHGNNEIGNLLSLKRTGELCEKYNALFHTDTVQTMGHYKIDTRAVKVDFLTCGAHKFHGPKGVGFLFKSEKIKIQPIIQGGAQERGYRGGTENLYGIVGLSKALEIACAEMEEHQEHISGLKKYMIDRLRDSIPGVQFNGDAEGSSLYTVLSVSFPPNEKGEMLLFSLDIQGIAASGGSACSSGSNKGSHVLGALHVDPARHNVRFSFSKYTTRNEIDYCIEKLVQLLGIPVAQKN